MNKNIEKIIFEVLKDEMAIDISNIGITDELSPLADTDDWSFIFVPELEKRLGISVPVKAWSQVNSVKEVASLLEEYVKPGENI